MQRIGEANTPLSRNVFPDRILAFDQLHFPRPAPSLDALLAQDRLRDLGMGFIPDEAEDVVATGEAVGPSAAVFGNTAHEVIGDAAIERPVRAAGEKIDIIDAVAHERERAAACLTKGWQSWAGVGSPLSRG